MKLKIDWQHATILLISGLTAFAPALLARVNQGTLGKVYAVGGPCMAVLSTCFALLKASIVQPDAPVIQVPEEKKAP